jgi:hypothetical protein
LYEERVPLALGHKTIPAAQPESSKRQKAVFEAEQTQYNERNEKTIDSQRETCEAGQVANQTGYECQSPSADILSSRDFQASNGLMEDWKIDSEVVTSQNLPPSLVGRFPLSTDDPEERLSPFGPCTTQSYFDMALPVNSAVSLYITCSIHGSHYSRFPCHLGSNPKFQHLALLQPRAATPFISSYWF